MSVGPVDVYIIGFPGNKFTGRIAPAIMEQVENGTIRVLDLEFVMKDADGVVTTLEISDLDAETGRRLRRRSTSRSRAPSDRRTPTRSARTSPPNSSALLIAVENLWAAKIVDALQAADAVLIDPIRIPVDVVEAVLTA